MRPHLALFLPLAATACGTTPQVVRPQLAVITPPPRTPSPPEPDPATVAEGAWMARADRNELEHAISIWERMATENLADPEVLARLSRAYFLLADGFMVPAGENGTSLAVYDKGIHAGEKALLAASPEFAARLEAGDSVEAALASVPQTGQAALYWYASNLGRFISADVTTAALYKDRTHAVMERVLELDPTYFCAGAHRFLGTFYARAPAFLGGDLQRSKNHFDRAIAIAPDFFENKVLLAEFYAPKIKDHELYVQLLTEVTESDPARLPELVPEQKIAQRRARTLLAEPRNVF